MRLVALGYAMNVGLAVFGDRLKPHQVTNGMLMGLTIMGLGIAKMVHDRERAAAPEHRML